CTALTLILPALASLRYSYDRNNDRIYDIGNGAYAGSAGNTNIVNIPASLLSDSGSRVIAGRVLDKDGGVNTYTTTILINNLPPTIAAIASKTVGMGSPLNVTGSISDPGASDTFTATIDYGDGAGPHSLTINPDRTFTLGGSYSTPGLYTATVNATDKDGGVATPVSFTVNVRGSSLVGTANADTWYVRLDAAHTNVEFYENASPPNPPTF